MVLNLQNPNLMTVQMNIMMQCALRHIFFDTQLTPNSPLPPQPISVPTSHLPLPGGVWLQTEHFPVEPKLQNSLKSFIEH